MTNKQLIQLDSIKETSILDFNDDELLILKNVCKDIKKNYVKMNLLDKRKHLSFFFYITTNLTIKDLIILKIKDVNFLFNIKDTKFQFIQDLFILFFNYNLENQPENFYVFSQILNNKPLKSNNLKKDIISIIIKYNHYNNFKLNSIKLKDIL